MNNPYNHRKIYDMEVGHKVKVRTFGVYNALEKEFIVITNGSLNSYVHDRVIVFEELNLELPESIPLEEMFAECERHCRKLVYTTQQSRGGQGWIHHDDRQPCNEKVKETRNTLLINFLTFLDDMS